MRYNNDKRIVMTLDAGGTNFVFSAVQSEEEIIEPIRIPAEGSTLEIVLNKIIQGFNEVKSKLNVNPVAISFCFPGPAEYELGIIGDLENLPTFRGGVALGPMLEEKFGIPVFINNDGDLFAYGEAIAGLLPEINERIRSSASPKNYQNLLGVTFGTGYGGGIVSRGQLFMGDNSAQGEINRMRNKLHTNASVEENVSIRGIRRIYCRETGLDFNQCPEPREIFEIGMGLREGNREAAIMAFHRMAEVAGDSIANAITLIDGLVVIGGGLAGAYPLFLQRLVDEMNTNLTTMVGTALDRMEIKAFNLEDEREFNLFYEGDTREIKVPFSSRRIKYDPMKRIGVGISRLGTSRAVSVGAYAYALARLDA
ncbi:MAG TPA: ROK family protein [Lentimicrobium sp.]|jgi:glucokinase|nr:ROK family protein [Lentimicrobium sp.]